MTISERLKKLEKTVSELENTVSNLYGQVQTQESEIFLLQTELEEVKEDAGLCINKRGHTEALPPPEPGDAVSPASL